MNKILENIRDYGNEIINDYTDFISTSSVSDVKIEASTLPSAELQKQLYNCNIVDFESYVEKADLTYGELNGIEDRVELIKLMIDCDNEWNKLLMVLKYLKDISGGEVVYKIDNIMRMVARKESIKSKVWENTSRMGLR